MADSAELVVLGRIAGTHGIRGELKVHAYAAEATTLHQMEAVLLRTPAGAVELFGIAGIRGSGKKILLALKGVDSINQVQHLVGRELCVRRDQLPPLAEDEYYWHDLLGLTVVTDGGMPLGVLKDIFATGSNDVYVVQGAGREYLIPALAEVVLQIDLVQRRMMVRPLDGLLDL